jgi:hypothetical protein
MGGLWFMLVARHLRAESGLKPPHLLAGLANLLSSTAHPRR